MFKSNDDFNIMLATDGYKLTHFKQYPPGTEKVHSYLESRGGKFPSTVFFGLQYFLRRYLEGAVVTPEKIDEADAKCRAYLGADYFNREGWRYIWKEHGGRLPVSIRAVREGTDVGTHNVLMTIENTDPKCFWLTNYLETMLVQVWYPTTVATLSNYIRRKLLEYLQKTGSISKGNIDYMFHDFGYRGVSSQESAALGGASHLLNFMGTDTIAGVEMLREYYLSGPMQQPIGVSIPASEHSTITSWGEDHEVDAMRNMLTSYPTGPVACVSDSYNIFRACSEYWGKELRMAVNQRDGVLVVRPDSGKPPEIVVACLERLGEAFGYTENKRGFKVLNPKVRVIQGDGVDYESISDVLDNMIQHGWAAENLAFGCGGALLQRLDRDTQKFAFKCSAIQINGEWRDVYKDPITDPGKKSKRGRLRLVKSGAGYTTANQHDYMNMDSGVDALVEVFCDGKVKGLQTLGQIRDRTREASNVW